MKKIEFGFSNDGNPTGSWEGIGIKEGLLLTDADYYGTIEYEGNNYIVTKVVDDQYNRYPQLLGKFIVRQALCDLYADGSANLMLNQEETPVTSLLENYLNSMQVKDNINSIEDILNYVNGVHQSPRSFRLIELDDIIKAVSIIPEVFEAKNTAINSCTMSVSELKISLSNSYNR